MGLEFMPIFEEWAVVYDDEVNGGNPEYQEVFANYWQILDEINAASGEVVLEFGSGTGNFNRKTSRCWQRPFIQSSHHRKCEISQRKNQRYTRPPFSLAIWKNSLYPMNQ